MSDDERYSDSESEQSEEETYQKTFPKTQKNQLNVGKNIKNNDDDDDDDDDSKVDDTEISDDENDDESEEGVNNEVKFDFQEDEDIDPEDIESDDDADQEQDEDEEEYKNVNEQTEVKKSVSAKKPKKQLMIIDDDDDDDDDEFNENYLEKFDADLVKNYIDDFHPECLNHNYDEISKLSLVIRNSDGIVIDPLHRTIPYLTKYEKTRVLGQRAKQIETGAKPFVKVPENIIEAHIIAELELKEKKIPFIIKRPIPSGGCEYWNLKDLEVISF
jgi:DNA-directed RNA polymerase subunit K/omega